MKKNIIVSLFALGCLYSNAIAQDKDSILLAGSEKLDKKYTVEIKKIQLTNEAAEFKIKIARPYNNKNYGIELILQKNKILGCSGSDTISIATHLSDGMEQHDYTIVRTGLIALQVFRDNVLLGKVSEKATTQQAGVTLLKTSSITKGFEAEVTSSTEAFIPDESILENHINLMLPSSCKNLAGDPYCNKGFTQSGLDAEDRTFYSQEAVYSGWGPSAYMDSENAYSGKYCIRLEGRSVYPNKGASLEQEIKLESGKTYYIRAMIKSEGYEGRVGIQHCNNYIRITDTANEWQQIEGVFTLSKNAEMIYVNNADYDNNGTLWIDNFEVYEGFSSIANIGLKTEVPYVSMKAEELWSPKNKTNVYMLGFTDIGSAYSQVDTSKVILKGGTALNKKVAGSQLYALYFPGNLVGMAVSGYFDGYTHNAEPLLHGVDYVLQRYEAPWFNYVNENETITAGCYLVQFVDNMDGQQISMTFGKTKEQHRGEKEYQLMGNPLPQDFVPEGQFLKFDESQQKFVLTENEKTKPFEAYIATHATHPVQQIVPNGTTGINRTYASDGTKLSVRATKGGVVVCAEKSCTINVYTFNGHLLKTQTLTTGNNTLILKPGLYLIGKQKVLISY